MKRNIFRNLALSGLAAVGIMFASVPASYARSTTEGGVRTSVMDSGDTLENKQVRAVSMPQSGQRSLSVSENLQYLNKPWFSHYTRYHVMRTLTATYGDRLGYFVVQDNEGNWYAFSPGSTAATSLPGKPQVTLPDAQTSMLGNDSCSLSSVGAGSVANGSPLLTARYSCTHGEQLDDVNYTLNTQVGTTLVPDQSAWFANVSGGGLYSVDSNGRVLHYSDKPSVDRGVQNGMISADDSTGSYPSVAASGSTFLITWNHTHDEPFEHVNYQTQDQKQGDYVSAVPAYMTFINGTEYEATPGTATVYRLSHRPVVQLGERLRRISVLDDNTSSPVVYSVSDTQVVVRDFYHHDEGYITDEYYIDHVGTMYYNTSYQVWMVAIEGHSYAVAWGDDSVNDSSVSVLHAPAGSTRPQYVVPSTSGDGMPPAVVPGADHSYGGNTAPAPAPSYNGVPGRAPSGIPGRGIPGRDSATAPACLPGRC